MPEGLPSVEAPAEVQGRVMARVSRHRGRQRGCLGVEGGEEEEEEVPSSDVPWWQRNKKAMSNTAEARRKREKDL